MMTRAQATALTAALLLLGAALTFVAFWPGIMVWDAIRQYGQAVSGHYDDWHPPAMNWLWRQFRMFGPGPAPMLVLQAGLYWAGFAILAARALRDRRPEAAIVVALLALMPGSIVLEGTILKDSLMAGILLVVTGLAAWRKPGSGWRAIPAALLLLAAATLRFNAVPACLPLALLFVPEPWLRGKVRFAGVAVAVAIPLLLALPLANRALGAERSHVELSLIVYDLGGITRYSGAEVMPPVAVPDRVKVESDCYSPVSWDRYAWWGDEPCAIGFANLAPILTRPGTSAIGVWLGAIAAHPLAYAHHRLAHFDREMRFLRGGDPRLPTLSLASDPNQWNFQVPPSRLRALIGRVANALLDRPPGWPILWVALALGVLIAGGGGDRLAIALAASSLLYALSYLPLGVASEVRYHLWTMIAAGLAAIRLFFLPGREPWRGVVLLALPLAAAVIGIVARLLL